jgi:hypothetical protein
MDAYTQWLKQGNEPIFEQNGVYWRAYGNGLVPASLKPEPVQLTRQQSQELLQRSGRLLVRYFSRLSDRPTNFWYTVCAEYDFRKLPQKLRSQVRRAYKDCRVERVDPIWLSQRGYECYCAAFAQDGNTEPESRAAFDQMCRGSLGGPFEFWGVFAGDQLVGFGKYVVGDDYVAEIVLKMDPNYADLNPNTAMQHAILSHYVAQSGKVVTIGFRSIQHDNQSYDLLQKFGYRRIYCDLKVAYRPTLKAAVSLAYPIRTWIIRFPSSKWARKMRAALGQEEIRRSFHSSRKRATQVQEPLLHRIVRSIWGNRYGTTLK